ncbi:MAG: DUF58 domain-containing protein [Pseudomonadota bacterium]|nr:DUF58 domain-containing protein [Pseudomonadota bacterium]
MIYPTIRAIGLAALGAPVALMAGLYLSGLWPMAAVWGLVVVALVVLDALLAAPPKTVTIEVVAPSSLPVAGEADELMVRLRFPVRAPRQVQTAVQANAHIRAVAASAVVPVNGAEGAARFVLTALRRGEGVVEQLWGRWTGPLGLAYRQRRFDELARFPVTADIAGVKAQAARLFARDAAFGVKVQRDIGEGSEYQTLREFQKGMDPRSVDWKQSARHRMLLSKEYRTERNHPVILALDTGRLMSEPLGGVPKIDRALNAALLLGYVSLKVGDRVGLFAFDARPRLISRPAGGIQAFPTLQRMAAKVDYFTEETNFTLGLTTLSGELERRSLVVVFTDFADPIGAEFMLENVARIARRHLVLFVMFKDDELEGLARAEPLTPVDISRAVIADTLLRQRRIVINRLRRIGVEIIEATADQIAPSLIARYIDLKRKDRL